MIYKDNWSEFIKVNYDEIINLSYFITQNQCDIDWIHDTIIKIHDYKSIDRFDGEISTIVTYIGNIIRWRWYCYSELLSTKSQHHNIDLFSLTYTDNELERKNVINDLDQLQVPDKFKDMVKMKLDGFPLSSISDKHNMKRHAVISYMNKYKKLLYKVCDDKHGYHIECAHE